MGFLGFYFFISDKDGRSSIYFDNQGLSLQKILEKIRLLAKQPLK